MTTWDEIRDEIAGMLADGKPLENVIAKLEQRKNEMAKANLLKAMDDMKKPKPMTNEEYLRSCTTEQLANTIFSAFVESATMIGCCVTLERFRTQMELTDALREWLKQPHTEKE